MDMPITVITKPIKLSVVIPAYNAAAYISECLDSVLTQICPHLYEVILVDDGSSDGTHELVQKLFPQVRLFRKANGGPGSARNYGVANALGEIIIFLDADDQMLPGRLAAQGGFMLSNPFVGLSIGNIRHQLNPEYDGILARGVCDSLDFSEVKDAYARLLTSENFVGAGVTAVRKEVYLEVGGQPEDIWVGEDYAMACAIARSQPLAATRRFLTWYREGHGNNLMASPHTYRGPVAVLRAELLNHGQRLSPAQYRQAFIRWCTGANMLLRWAWIEDGNKAVRAEMKTLRPLLPAHLYTKWLTLSILPSSVGRAARAMKRCINQLSKKAKAAA